MSAMGSEYCYGVSSVLYLVSDDIRQAKLLVLSCFVLRTRELILIVHEVLFIYYLLPEISYYYILTLGIITILFYKTYFARRAIINLKCKRSS